MNKFISVLCMLTCSLVFAENVYVDGAPVPQSEIDKVINQLKKNPMFANQLSNPQVKKDILTSIGMQKAILKEGDAKGLDKTAEYQEKVNQAKAMVYAEIMRQSIPQPTQAELKAAYEQKKKMMGMAKEYNISHILVKDQKTADEVLKKLVAGDDFAKLAKEYSQDPGSKNNGGSLGWSTGENFVPEFTNAAKALKKGEYTKTAVKSSFGFHIIKMVDIRNKQMPSFDSEKAALSDQIYRQKMQAVFDGIKTKHKVEVK